MIKLNKKLKPNSAKVFLVAQFILLGIGYFFYTINRTAFPVGLKDIGNTFQFSIAQTTALGTVFLLGQAIIDIPAGYMADRVRRRDIFFGSLIGTGLIVILFTFFTFNYSTAVIWRVTFGIAEGIFNVCLFSFIGTWFSKRRGLFTNLMSLFYSVGTFVGPPLFGYMLMASSNWRFPLQIFGIFTIVWGFVILFAFRINEDDYPSLAEQKNRIPEGEGLGSSLRKMIKNSKLWRALSIIILHMIPQWGFAGVGAYLLINQKHISTLQAGLIIGTAFGLGQALSPLFGYLSDKFGRRPIFVILAAIAASSFYFLFISNITTPWLLTGFGFTAGVSNTIYYLGYATIQDAVNPEYTGLATGLGAAIGYMTGSFSGALIGLVTNSFGYHAAAYLCLILPEVLIILVALFLLKK